VARQVLLRRAPWVLLRDAAAPPVEGIDAFCARPHVIVTPDGRLSGALDALLAAQGRVRRVALGVSGFALLPGVLGGSDLLATVPDFVAAALAAPGLAIEPHPLALPPVANHLAWPAALDGDVAEAWFRAALREALAAA
jgi:LysR family transcriptional regulator, mexEF-oprN operon transcriptional activator